MFPLKIVWRIKKNEPLPNIERDRRLFCIQNHEAASDTRADFLFHDAKGEQGQLIADS